MSFTPVRREQVITYLRRLSPTGLATLVREALGPSAGQAFLIAALKGLSNPEIVEILAQAKGVDALEVAAGLVTRAGAQGGARLEALLQQQGPAAGQVLQSLMRGLFNPK
jgi:hypothetical protein